MLLYEARLAARIQHPNVVPTLDVVLAGDQILLVMEYVRGDSLSRLIRAAQLDGEVLPPNVVVAIMLNTLAGLHAAHEATDERGQPMEIVHRDVSPQNVIVGVDGIARVLDFGIAKAEGRVQTTKDGHVKGKVMYNVEGAARGRSGHALHRHLRGRRDPLRVAHGDADVRGVRGRWPRSRASSPTI